MTRSLARLGGILGVLLVASMLTASAGGDWNDSQIGWLDYEKGLAAAKTENKPICLVFYTEWCPHCTNYSRVFHDPKVVERSKKFVMVRLDRDQNREISGKFAPDGEYIPRTLFLSSAGAFEPSIVSRSDQWKYFYDEQDPASLLAGMDRAEEKFAPKP